MSTKSFFDGYSVDFDSIYGDGIFDRKRSLFERITDRLFRGAMKIRFEYVGNSISHLPPNSSILDAGCGGGVYLHFLIGQDCQTLSYTGFDFAPSMLELAKKRSLALQLSDRTTLTLNGIDDFDSVQKYDLVIAMGFFDYMKNPKSALEKLIDFSKGEVIISIPKANHWLAAQRKIRYKLRDCELNLYTDKQLDLLLDQYKYEITDAGRDWIVRIDVS